MRKQRTNAEVDGDRKGFVVLRASLLLLFLRRSAPASEPASERFQRALENLETSAPLQPPSLTLPHPPSHPSLLLHSLSFSVSCLNAGCTRRRYIM